MWVVSSVRHPLLYVSIRKEKKEKGDEDWMGGEREEPWVKPGSPIL